jgi:tRNA nucleotidyltransferase (CCA-adding enzyme)
MIVSPQLDDFLKDLGAAANYLGHEVFIVGGFLRNLLYKEFHDSSWQVNQDIDLVINTNAIEFSDKFQKFYEDNHDEHISFDIIESFAQFGTVKINHPEKKDFNIEIASTRTETYKEAAAFPTVKIINSIEDDLQRRDFTINALLMSLNKTNFAEIIDHVGALKDLENKKVKVFHQDSFIDDPTRIYRAVRMKLEYNFEIENETLTYLQTALKHPEFNNWFLKRKNRFAIEKNKIINLGENKSKEAEKFFMDLDHKF